MGPLYNKIKKVMSIHELKVFKLTVWTFQTPVMIVVHSKNNNMR